jgi:hypothetical protein
MKRGLVAKECTKGKKKSGRIERGSWKGKQQQNGAGVVDVNWVSVLWSSLHVCSQELGKEESQTG